MAEPLDQAEPSAENSERTATRGRPFEKGISGNPGGRKKGLAGRVRETIGEDGESLVGFWGAVLSGELRTVRTVLDAKGEPTGKTETTYEKVSVSDRLAVSKILAERGWGKPAEFVPIEDSNPLDFGIQEDETIADALERRCTDIAEARRRRDEREAARRGETG
jgi:hypothetical protein